MSAPASALTVSANSSAKESSNEINIKEVTARFTTLLHSLDGKSKVEVKMITEFNSNLPKLSSEKKRLVLRELPVNKALIAILAISDKTERELWGTELARLLADRIKPLSEVGLFQLTEQFKTELVLALISLTIDFEDVPAELKQLSGLSKTPFDLWLTQVRRLVFDGLPGGKKTILLPLITDESERTFKNRLDKDKVKRIWQAQLNTLLSDRIRPYLANPNLIDATDAVIEELNLDLATLTDDTNQKFDLLLQLQYDDLNNFCRLLQNDNAKNPVLKTWENLITKVIALSRNGSPSTSPSDSPASDSPTHHSKSGDNSNKGTATTLSITTAVAAAAMLDLKVRRESDISKEQKIKSDSASASDDEASTPPGKSIFSSGSSWSIVNPEVAKPKTMAETEPKAMTEAEASELERRELLKQLALLKEQMKAQEEDHRRRLQNIAEMQNATRESNRRTEELKREAERSRQHENECRNRSHHCQQQIHVHQSIIQQANITIQQHANAAAAATVSTTVSTSASMFYLYHQGTLVAASATLQEHTYQVANFYGF